MLYKFFNYGCLVPVLSRLALAPRSGVIQNISKGFQYFLDNGELRLMVLFSLSIQCILILFGAKRQSWTNIYLRIILWSAYLFADWLATTSLGVLSNKSHCVEPEHAIVALWGPILLLHLGGQDTITAYSMEDNALWSRRLVTYIGQVVAAILIFLRSRTYTDLNSLAILIFIAGFIKIGERIWVLWRASSQQFKESLFPDPDPGPNYARYMETYNSASYEGYRVNVEFLIQSPSTSDDAAAAVDHYTYGPAVTVRTANRLLKISKLLFADLILSFQDVSESRSSLLSGNGKRGFEVMEIELGFMYDVFYTKAPIVYSFIGCFLRFATLSCSIIVCVFFFIKENQYPRIDVVITGVLLLGAIVFDMYSVISMLFSDWTMMWLTMHKNKVTCKIISLIQYVKCKKRWSCSIGQFNLISFCLLRAKKERYSEPGMCGFNCGKTFKTNAAKTGLATMITGAWLSYEKYKHTNTNTVSVTDDLKEIIFEHFVNKTNVEINNTRFYYNWGNKVLEGLQLGKKIETISWSVEVEFDQSILLWHIATNLCYNSVADEEVLENGRSYRETSKWLSEYMLYLLVMRPSMLPNGIGEIRFQDTCAEATEFVRDRRSIQNENQVSQILHRVCKHVKKVLPSTVKGDRSKSVLFDACRLAKNVREMRNDDEEWETKKMWKFITQVWVEMLAYAASNCKALYHAQHLRHGGELLTHVWLLMAHLGITDKLQISKGFGRAKLIRK
ncbi:uncharacterized protein LOC123886296 [Trifolium pratense]|uniref:uncharacterized protein LOC123886296 n=1 Tax=Trifolium pratense TaxID=57577 RepID=UPI001E6954D5|nr:uncharacterized protein LOC123886296 [Trifolium pratense]